MKTATDATIANPLTYQINSDTYNAVSALTVKVNADDTSLTSGSVVIDSTNSDVALTSAEIIGVTNGNGVIVNANENGLVSVSNIGGNNSDTFTVTADGNTVTYTSTVLGLFKTEDDVTSILNLSETEKSELGNDSYTFVVEAENNWTTVEIRTGEVGSDTIEIAADTENTTYVTADLSTVVATYDATDKKLTAGDSVVNAKNINITDVAVAFEGNYSSATFTLNSEIVFSNVAGESFKVDSSATDSTVAGATALTLSSGTITAAATGQIVTASGTVITSIDSTDVKSYQVGINEEGAVSVEIGKVSAGNSATVNMTGNAIINATTDLKGDTANIATYVFGNQTFEVRGDTEDIEFTVENGKVTKITGLDEGSMIDITSNEAFNIVVNEKGTSFAVEAGKTLSLVGTVTDDISDASGLMSDRIYIEITANGVKYYTIDPETNAVSEIENDWIDSEYITLDDAEEGYKFTFSDSFIPDKDKNAVIVANKTDNKVELVSNKGSYVINVPSIGESNNVAVHLTSSGGLKLVSLATDNSRKFVDLTAVPTISGEIELPAGKTLTVVSDFTIATGTEDSGTVLINAANDISIEGDGIIVTKAPADTQFELAQADGGYTVNEQTYKSDSTAKVIASANSSALVEGTVILDDATYTKVSFVSDTKGAELSVSSEAAEGTTFEVTAAGGVISNVSALDVGESFEIKDASENTTTYSMAKLGLFAEVDGVLKFIANDTEGKLDKDESTTDVDDDYVYTITEFEDWATAVVSPDSDLTLTGITSDTIFVNSAYEEIVANVDVAENDVLNITSGTGLATDVTINVEADKALTTDFDATVKSAGTITVNTIKFTSTNNDALEIAATYETEGSAALIAGTVTVSDTIILESTYFTKYSLFIFFLRRKCIKCVSERYV